MKLESSRELKGQTALRGIAAITVFFAHAEFFHLFPNTPWLAHLYSVFYWHNIAVDLFFTLSGFILCYVYSARPFTWRNYGLSRFARIYPLYFLTFAVYVLMGLYAFSRMGHLSPEINFPTLICSLFAVQDWPLLPHFVGINFPSWSISVEIFLYIFIFPLLIKVHGKLTLKQKLAMVVIPITIRSLVYVFILTGSRHDLVDGFFAPFRGILCFTAGFFTCSIGRDLKFPSILSRKAEWTALILITLLILIPYDISRELSVICFPVLVYLSALDTSVLSGLLNRGPTRWLGDLSYSIYLWHWLILKFFAVALGMRELGSMHTAVHHSVFYNVAFMLFTIATVLAVSHLSHYFFEKPVNGWIKKKLDSNPR